MIPGLKKKNRKSPLKRGERKQKGARAITAKKEIEKIEPYRVFERASPAIVVLQWRKKKKRK